jgi:D-sedoheptulose 7-phosphate isomerase
VPPSHGGEDPGYRGGRPIQVESLAAAPGAGRGYAWQPPGGNLPAASTVCLRVLAEMQGTTVVRRERIAPTIRPFRLTDGNGVGAKAGLLLSGLDEHREVFGRLAALSIVIEEAAGLIQTTLSRGGKLMLCGNGGSAADSQHLAAELTGRFVKDRRPLAAVALSTDTSALTSIGNDYGFDEVFSRQVTGLGRRGDCLLAISTSGSSRNVARAAEAARAAGISVIGLLGRDGGVLRGLCDVAIVVPSATTARIQEAHIFIGHTLCALVEAALGLAGAEGRT